MRVEYIIGIVILVLGGVGLFIILQTPSAEDKNLASTEDYDVRPYQEIVNPSGFVNTGGEPIQVADYIGKQVILLDIMTYSCINCQRTFPYVNGWYEKYKDAGLIVIGIHTPEFAFEKDIENVKDAMERYGIKHPVVLDNDYSTWGALGNRFWPRKYLIDINGNIVYDHIGEGAYEVTEAKIQELLAERQEVLGMEVSFDGSLVASSISKVSTESESPETYFGNKRNEYLANKVAGSVGATNYLLPSSYELNKLYLGGVWDLRDESATAMQEASLIYKYNAKEVYIVAGSETPVTVEVWQDGKLVEESGGEDVENGMVEIQKNRLYKLIKNESAGEHTLELRVKGTGISFFAFTFG